TQLKTIKDSAGRITIRFNDYDSVIGALAKNKGDDGFYRSAAMALGNAVWKLAKTPVRLEVDPIQDFDSRYSERLFTHLLSALRSKAEQSGFQYHDWGERNEQNLPTNKLSYEKCAPFFFLYSQVLLEQLATQAKSVYYEPTIAKKKAAHTRAIKTFSNLRDIVRRNDEAKKGNKPAYMHMTNFVAGNAFLLASELTNDGFFKPQFASKDNNYIALYTLGESTTYQLKHNLLAKSLDSITVKAKKRLAAVPTTKRNRVTMDDYIEQALTAEVTHLFGYVIDDEKARMLGDKWKLYNNSAQYFQLALESNLRARQQNIDTGWDKQKIVDRALKATAYNLEQTIDTPSHDYILLGQLAKDDVSKITTWRSLATFMKGESRLALSDYGKGIERKLYVDGRFKGRVFQNAKPFM
ncbi:MAG: hypothetical protein MJK04_31135, partial [Psychrosphaera sp.]|nr:hypothetical protein [Psychrosphaera sp.]